MPFTYRHSGGLLQTTSPRLNRLLAGVGSWHTEKILTSVHLDNTMDRRFFLRYTTAGFSSVFAGCIGGNTDLDGAENTKPSGSQSRTSEYQYDGSRHDPIFIENMVNFQVVVDVRVEHLEDSDVLIDNSYRVPAKTGLEIPDIAAVGSGHEVRATYGETTEEYGWTVLTCAHEDGPEAGGETAVGIEVDDRYEGSLAILHTGCDEAGAGDHRELPYEEHDEYIVHG